MWILVRRPKIYVYMSGNNLGWCILEMHSKKVICNNWPDDENYLHHYDTFYKANLKISSFHILTSQKHISHIFIFRNWFIVLPQLYFVVTALFFFCQRLIFFLAAALFHRFIFFATALFLLMGLAFFAALFCCHRFMFLLSLKWRRT